METWIKQKAWRMFITLFIVSFVISIIASIMLNGTGLGTSELLVRNLLLPLTIAAVFTLLYRGTTKEIKEK